MSTNPRTVGILLFDDVEVLDAFGPFEVFSVAQTPESDDTGNTLFRVVTIAETSNPVTTRGGLVVQPHHTIADHPPLDIMLVPGGGGSRSARKNPTILDWVRDQAGTVVLRTSVCTGALIYAEAGLLNGRTATTHWGSLDLLKQDYPEINVQANVKFVDEGSIITSAGISAGIDMALHIVARLHGEESAVATARYMEYDWHPDRDSQSSSS